MSLTNLSICNACCGPDCTGCTIETPLFSGNIYAYYKQGINPQFPSYSTGVGNSGAIHPSKKPYFGQVRNPMWNCKCITGELSSTFLDAPGMTVDVSATGIPKIVYYNPFYSPCPTPGTCPSWTGSFVLPTCGSALYEINSPICSNVYNPSQWPTPQNVDFYYHNMIFIRYSMPNGVSGFSGYPPIPATVQVRLYAGVNAFPTGSASPPTTWTYVTDLEPTNSDINEIYYAAGYSCRTYIFTYSSNVEFNTYLISETNCWTDGCQDLVPVKSCSQSYSLASSTQTGLGTSYNMCEPTDITILVSPDT